MTYIGPQFAAVPTPADCRSFQLDAVSRKGSVETFNPKVVGSISHVLHAAEEVGVTAHVTWVCVCELRFIWA